jgi:hypothetical protein
VRYACFSFGIEKIPGNQKEETGEGYLSVRQATPLHRPIATTSHNCSISFVQRHIVPVVFFFPFILSWEPEICDGTTFLKEVLEE